MFCVYCKNPFDENSKVRFCAGCGKELFRGNSQAPAQQEATQQKPEPQRAYGLKHACVKCGTVFSVCCAHCGAQSIASGGVPPEG
jgi:succinate dehydrogenase/fumarate reductase-like Fe-S protein